MNASAPLQLRLAELALSQLDLYFLIQVKLCTKPDTRLSCKDLLTERHEAPDPSACGALAREAKALAILLQRD